jgi:uncharacterized membrane protein
VSTAAEALDRTVARVLRWGIGASIALLAVGVALMVISGVDPLGPPPPAFDPAGLLSSLLALDPLPFLWVGLAIAIATPSLRVIASLIGFARTGQRRMVIVSVGILIVIGLSVAVASGAA